MKRLSTVYRNILLLSLLFNVFFQKVLTAQSATIGKIYFSKDSLAISGFELNARSFTFPQPVSIVQWDQILSQQHASCTAPFLQRSFQAHLRSDSSSSEKI